MEKGLNRRDLFTLLEEEYQLPRRDYTQYSPLTLAYIGDAVYDLVIRTLLVRRANMQTAKLHRMASAHVNARQQARLAQVLETVLTEEEAAVYRRGCNAKPATMAKGASREEYLQATGLEALFGYLYLTGQYERLLEMIRKEISTI